MGHTAGCRAQVDQVMGWQAEVQGLRVLMAPLLLPTPGQALGVPAPLPVPVERRPLAGGDLVALGIPSSLCPPATLTGL